ncbi:MAG: murein biosynthesis integral membrane protein MurJ [Ruminococcaceae bacterium]|nr:murein biosynthesis integral membrane protein MurJ [Oscillospiraceae bacterium]
MENTKKLIKTAGFMIVATFAAKLCGMLRDSFIGAFFGTGSSADAYFAATKIPLLFFDVVIGGVISAAFIPVFNEYLEKSGKRRAIEFANRFINVILVITGVMCALGIIFAPQLVELITPGLSPDTKLLAIKLSNILFPMIIFTGLAFSFVGILQSFGEFNIPAIISLVSNGMMILYLLIFKDKFGVVGLSVAMLVGWTLQAAVQIPSLIKFEYKYSLDFHFADEGLKKTALLALPLLVSTWVQPIGSLVNMRFASSLGEGVMSALEYANRLYIIMVGVFSFVVTNLVFPSLSRANASNNTKERHDLMHGALKSVSLVMFPLMAGFIILSKPVVSLIYQYGEFDTNSVYLTSTALTYYSVGMIGYSYAEVLNKSFFAMQDSKTPMITALISIGANIVLSYLLSKAFGIGGLALASALASTLNAALNFVMINKRTDGIFDKGDAADIIKIVLSVIVMSAVVLGVYSLSVNIFGDDFIGRALKLMLPAGAGAAIYALMCIVLKVSEMTLLIDTFFHKKR